MATAEPMDGSSRSWASWYAISAITRDDPDGSPSRTADGNTENAITKFRHSVTAAPGSNNGKITYRNRWPREAPRVAAACSSDGSIPDAYASISRNANGNPLTTRERNTPHQLLVSRIG